ncbi:hypothetical protein VTP01DRAFT_2773 [Rhizomucor pusillus]|uniref:uncharacterized protein n=1 Tax=Rhizomucor pusillus TaxID=4840 RepID=UPI0037433416
MSTRLIVAAFWSVILVGIPFWWKTTEVYRASLPFAEIDSWQTQQTHQLEFPLHFYIHTPRDLKADQLSQHLETTLQSEFAKLQTSGESSIHVESSLYDSDVPQDHLLEFHDNAPIGHYHIYVQPIDLITGYEYNATVGTGRTLILQVNKSTSDLESSIVGLVKGLFVQEYQFLDSIVRSGDNDNNDMRAMKYSKGYQITFSLMNGDPESVHVDWDIRDAIQSYLSPLLGELSILSNFTVDSQIQHYASLSMKPQFRPRDGTAGYHYFDPEQLPHFVNSADWNLASTISAHPTLNFLVYIPPLKERLWIHDSNGQRLRGNAFLIPRWGGVVIRNVPGLKQQQQQQQQNQQVVHLDKQALKPAMATFVSQLRTLMGVQDAQTIKIPQKYNVTFLPAPRTGITLMEKDALVRRRTAENIVNAASTLHSLAQLVEEIPNMVVLDHIGRLVRESLLALEHAREALQRGDYEQAVAQSIDAIDLAEKAFFDPTMVSMLYFPDEHKYAIYMPLFVPISVPLIMAVVKSKKTGGINNKEKQE